MALRFETDSTIIIGLAAPAKQKQKHVKTKASYVIYKARELELSCFDLLKIKRLNLSGCAVISRGILVVEGETNAVKKFNNFVMKRRKQQGKIDVWQGLVSKSSFGKFSILRCANDSAARKFFVAHGASRYWDLAVESTFGIS